MVAIRPNAEPAATTVAAGDIFLIDGGTGVRALAASVVPIIDASGNIAVNNVVEGFATTATAAGTTTLTVTSAAQQFFTGTTTQTVVLPVVSTLKLGQAYFFQNSSTGAITIQSSGANTVKVIGPGAFAIVTCIAITGTTAASWQATYFADIVVSGKTLTLNNSLTFSGTDGTTMTFPSTSATLARTDAANTFTGTQTIGALVATTVNGNTITTGTGVLTLGAGKTLTANNSLTLAGTDGTTQTFPSTSGTVITSVSTALPTGTLANPSGTIGLTASNGTATTAMRSDASPALSQAIAPTWTGKHIWSSGGLELTNAPPLSGTFTGSGLAANFGINQHGAASSATTPEIGAQFTLTSGVGSANLTSAYKIGFTSSVIATVGSANIYGGNVITQKGSGAHILQSGLECDQNNNDRDEITLGGSTATYGVVSVAAGGFKSTAAYWATSNAVPWQYGFAASNTSGSAVNLATFYDGTQSADVLLSDSIHTFGVNFFSAQFSGGYSLICPNNAGVGSANAAAGATFNLVKLDSSNAIQHGDTSVTKHNFNVNPGGAAAAFAVVNSHATAGDIVMQLQGGAATAVDTTTLYLNMVNPTNSVQRGQIIAADSGGVGHVAYQTASDENLKKSLGLLPDALERLSAIEVHRYQGRDYEGTDYDVGFFAQNLYKAFPWAVTPSDDPDYKLHPWQVDYGRVTPLLVAAAQALLERVENLESTVQALSGRSTNA